MDEVRRRWAASVLLVVDLICFIGGRTAWGGGQTSAARRHNHTAVGDGRLLDIFRTRSV